MSDTIIILANSVKHGQHCVAGKLVSNGSWVRLVADENGAALSDEQARYNNPYGRFTVKPLQKIRTNLVRHVPLAHQPENFLSDNDWTQAYTLAIDDLPRYQDNPDSLWGLSNKVNELDVTLGLETITQSLYLIKVLDLNLYKNENKRRASFIYNDEPYDLPCTDPNFDSLLDGTATHNNFLCISLGEAFEGYHYKIVATIL